MAVLDSGERTVFNSGAMRDVQGGKGRCDLLPLDVVARLYRQNGDARTGNFISAISSFQKTKDEGFLFIAAMIFMERAFYSINEAILEVSVHFEDGCAKYGKRNWEKGIPISRYIDSALRHYFKWLRGDKDEHHDRAVLWNLLCAIWTIDNVEEMIDG
jgi:hypothetical protein